MGAPPVLIGQATQRMGGGTVTVYEGRARGPRGGGGGLRGGWRGGDGGASCIDWTGHTEEGKHCNSL